MFREKTVIIVGAGASYDVYGLPLGGELASNIAKNSNFFFERHSHRPTRGDPDFFEEVLWRRFNTDHETLNKYTAAGQRLAQALSSTVSIDDALYLLSENDAAVTLGKILIMRSIQRAEAASQLAIDPRTTLLAEDAGKLGWIEQIFSIAITNHKLSSIQHAFDNITFVIFNYDRCVEFYIYCALQRVGLNSEDASEIVERLDIIRPYGSIGSILPQAPNHLRFGDKRYLPYFNLIERIRTFTESDALHDRSTLVTKLSSARLIMFLGFGFHPQNMELIGLEASHPVVGGRVLATMFGVHEANVLELRNEVGRKLRMSRDSVEAYAMTSSEILKSLRPKISLLVS